MARFVNAQQDQIVTYTPLSHPPVHEPSVLGKRLDSVLSVVVIPRDSIMIQELKESRPILDHSFPKFLHKLRLESYTLNISQPFLGVLLMFSQISFPQSKSVNSIYNLTKDLSKPASEILTSASNGCFNNASFMSLRRWTRHF